jgi:hypothetical protein
LLAQNPAKGHLMKRLKEVPAMPKISTQLGAFLSFCLAAAFGGGDAPKAAAMSGVSQPEVSKASPKIDPCSLLTAEEIEAAVGWKPVKAEPNSYGGVEACNFYGPKGLSQSVSLAVAPGMPKVASSAEMAQWRKKQTEGYGDIKFVIEPIEGLGVPAIRNEVEGAGLATVEAAAKGVLLDVSTSNLEHSKALTAKALPRLP